MGRGERDDVTSWAGGGGTWEPDPPKKPDPPPQRPDELPTKPEKPAKKRGVQLTEHGGSGVVCGRFLPLHRGHQYVIDVARGSVQDLLVLVFASPNDPIAGPTRVRWLRELYPEVAVELVERTASSLVAPELGELVRAIAQHRKDPPRYFFASEPAYAQAAAAIGAVFVPVDPSRVAVPISGTSLRADVVRHFAMLPDSVRPWFVRRVAVIGAESTGKSTLCAQLAEHYQTLHVPEYARTLAEAGGGELDAEGLALAGRGQRAAEEALARRANRVLICDTDARMAALWSERLYGEAPAWLTEQAYDLVLLTSLDEPFVGRADRDHPAARAAFHAKLGERECVKLVGDRAARFAQATTAIDRLLARGGFLAARASAL